VADVLFGDYNPAGRLPVTFYRTLAQLDNALAKAENPEHEGFQNYNMEGRTYRYMRETPLYPFGHGLSYSTFDYGQVELPQGNSIKAGEGLSLTIPVTNTSERTGEEVVQVYVKRNDDAEAPVQSLRAFRRTAIEPGQTANITLEIAPESFAFYDSMTDALVVKPGSYTILYGGTSAAESLTQLAIQVE
jgi:beta-glucosidase